MPKKTDFNEMKNVWDILRDRYKIDVSKYTNQKKLVTQTRKQMNLRKGQRSKGHKLNFLKAIQSKPFWQATKQSYQAQQKRGKGFQWKESEELVLGELMNSYHGRILTQKFNDVVKPSRSNSSVQVKASRLRTKK